ncbi:hypothetical protein LCGC14_0195770 [marine sediment metagenome]|uniref:Uncharacterized protein n=1 Tax=marine sediment metagenome TaxID=412755 RepID=A0A0F9UQ21_9ZZZZ
MIEQKCDLSSCEKQLSIAENEEEFNKVKDLPEYQDKLPQGSIAFSYKTFFFCSPEHSEEYAN